MKTIQIGHNVFVSMLTFKSSHSSKRELVKFLISKEAKYRFCFKLLPVGCFKVFVLDPQPG